ncbi:MAG: transporter substrate-binding domain-containing protein [Alteromonadales bacterium]|nr:transporter substrate-binding domain-containing protein [Alteromonadales bacterium]
MKQGLLIVFMLIASLAQASSQDKITISYHNFPPFSYQHNKQAKGSMIDLIDKVCENAQLSCDYKFYPNRRAKNHMAAGIVTGNIPLGWNEERAKTMWFSVPLLNTEYGFYSKSGTQPKYLQLSNIKGKTVGVFGPSNTETTLNNLQKAMQVRGILPIEIEVMPNVNEHGLEKLLKGRYELYFVNKSVGDYLISNHGINGVEYIGSTHKLGYYVCFAKAHVDPDLIRRFNRSILQLYKSNSFTPIYNKWQILPGNFDLNHLIELDILH